MNNKTKSKLIKYIICFYLGILALYFFGNIIFPTPIKQDEKYYITLFSKYIDSNRTEYRLKDNSRVDIITNTYAIEIDFAHNWYEAIGQSLYYSIQTGLKPGIVLIIENEKYLNKLLVVANKYNITIWSIDKISERIRAVR